MCMCSRVKSPVCEDLFSLVELFKLIHLNCAQISECSPRRYLSFLQTYLHIYESRIVTISETQQKLQVKLLFFSKVCYTLLLVLDQT